LRWPLLHPSPEETIFRAEQETMIKAIVNFLYEHRAKSTFVAYLVFTTAVHTMPMPISTHGFYAWFYPFIHALAGGIFSNNGDLK